MTTGRLSPAKAKRKRKKCRQRAVQWNRQPNKQMALHIKPDSGTRVHLPLQRQHRRRQLVGGIDRLANARIDPPNKRMKALVHVMPQPLVPKVNQETDRALSVHHVLPVSRALDQQPNGDRMRSDDQRDLVALAGHVVHAPSRTSKSRCQPSLLWTTSRTPSTRGATRLLIRTRVQLLRPLPQ